MKKSLLTPMIAAAVLGAALSGCSASDPNEGEDGTKTEESATSEETRLPPIEVVDGEVPEVRGHSLHAAITALREGRLLYEIEGEGFVQEDEVDSTREWTVIEQTPAPGGEIEDRGTVELTVEKDD